MISLGIHDVVSIKIKKAQKLSSGDYVKQVIIKSGNEEIAYIDLFSDSKQKLKGEKV